MNAILSFECMGELMQGGNSSILQEWTAGGAMATIEVQLIILVRTFNLGNNFFFHLSDFRTEYF
jgi:hypothetical protein